MSGGPCHCGVAGAAALLLCLAGCAVPAASQHAGTLAGYGSAAMELLQGMDQMAASRLWSQGETTTTRPGLWLLPGASAEGQRVLDSVSRDCSKVPELVQQQWERSQCKANMSELVDVSSYMLGSMQRFARLADEEHPEGNKKQADMDTHLQQQVHTITQRFCEHPECQEGVRSLLQHNADCFTDGLCALMSEKVPFQLCRPGMHILFLGAVELEVDAMCLVEPGTSMYCPELNVMLMAEHFECWRQIHKPAEGCSPHCAKVWAEAKRRFPECSSMYAEQIARSQGIAQKLFSALGLDAGMGGKRSHQEICSDLQFLGGLSDFLV